MRHFHNTIHFLLSTDKGYVMPTGVLMCSIGENCGRDVAFHILVDESFSDSNKEELRRIAQKYESEIDFHTITEEQTKGFPFLERDLPGHVTVAAYYRLFVASVLPKDIHRVIYLDGDMLVRTSLEKLWMTDLTGMALGVTHDMGEQEHCLQRRLPYDMSLGYFNSGMLVMNLDYWRENHVEQRCLDFIRRHRDVIVWHDQDVLNSVLAGKVRWVSTAYNLQNGYLYENAEINEAEADEIEECIASPAIIHYSCKTKPWHRDSDHPFTDEWRKYLSMTQWKDYRFDYSRLDKMPSCKTLLFWKLLIAQLLRRYRIGHRKWWYGKQYKDYALHPCSLE